VLRVGALKARAIDVRFVAATNRNLDEQIARGAFRADLYFRLNGISLVIPPLRERRSELMALATTFIAAAAKTASVAVPTLSERARAGLLAHDWPGNIRELRNAMERAVLLADDVIEPEHLPLAAPAPPKPPLATDLHGELDQIERQRIFEVLERCGGNQSRAAIELGISRGTLSTRLKAYGVSKPRPRGR
jgi:two-component system, NtrC family, response regulator AtoC